MGFIFFGIGFGLFMGLGMYLLIIRPALKERASEEKAASEKSDQQNHE